MPTDDFFHARLDQMIDLHHPLTVLANRLPWVQIEAALAPVFARKNHPCLSGCLPMIAHGGVSGLKVVCGRISASRTSAIRTLV